MGELPAVVRLFKIFIDNFGILVGGHLAVHEVAGKIHAGVDVFIQHEVGRFGAWTGDKVVVDKVHRAALVPVQILRRVFSAPVIHHIVGEVKEKADGVLVRGFGALRAGIARVVVREEVVMIGGELAAAAVDQGAFGVLAGVVDGIVQAFRDESPLDGDIIAPGDGERFVHTPAHGAVVDYHILRAGNAHGVFFQQITQAHADVADDGLVRLHIEAVIFERDAAPRGGLSGDGDIRVGYLERFFERDIARHFKNDNPRTGGFHRCA